MNDLFTGFFNHFFKLFSIILQISSVFIINLAITDVGCATTVMPFCLVSIWFDRWIFGHFACGLVCFLNYCFIIVSMWTLALISIDRHLYCIYPFRYQDIMSHRRALVLAIMAWGLGLTFGSLPSFLRVVIYDHAEIICAVDWENDPVKVLTYTISAFVLCFMTPVFVMAYCYHGLYKIAHRHAKQLQQRPTGQIAVEPTNNSDVYNEETTVYIRRDEQVQNPDKRKKEENRAQERRTSRSSKAIRSICIMIAAYLICNTPFSLTKLLKCVFSNNDVVPFYVNTLASWIAFVNPCCNPIIYSIYREDFKAALRKLFPTLLSVKTQISPATVGQSRKVSNQRTLPGLVSDMNVAAASSSSAGSNLAFNGGISDHLENSKHQPVIIITPPLSENRKIITDDKSNPSDNKPVI